MTKKRRRRNTEQIVRAIQEGEAMLFAGTEKPRSFKLDISSATWDRWKKQFGFIKCDEAKRLRELEVENQRLKELLAEAELDRKILKMVAEGKF